MKFITIFFLLTLSCLFTNTIISQTLFWSGEGAVLKARDLETGDEKIIFEPDFFYSSNFIDHIALDPIEKKIYFQIHYFEPQPQNILLTVIDYSGENMIEIEDFSIPTSMVYNHAENSLYYTISGGSLSQIGIRKYNIETGSDNLIYNASSCFDLRLDEDDNKLYFKEGGNKMGINSNGTGLHELSFLPPDPNSFASSNFSIEPVNNDFYLTSSPILGGTIYMQRVNEDGSQIDTLLEEPAFGGGFTYNIPEAPFIDAENNKLYYFWIEDDFFSDEIKKIFRSSNLDGSNIQNLDIVTYSSTSDPIDAWAIDPNYSDITSVYENYPLGLHQKGISINQVHPNPSVSDFNVEFNSIKNQEVRLHVLDINGIIVFKTQLKAIEGENLVQVNLPSSLSKGIYFVVIQGERGKETTKFIKL